MQRIYSKILILLLFSTSIVAQEQIGVAAAVNRNTTDLTLEQERKLVEAGYQIIQNPWKLVGCFPQNIVMQISRTMKIFHFLVSVWIGLKL